jgi:PTS system nitrogen regulatory IIA component
VLGSVRPEQDEILTLAELAVYLKVSEKTVLRMVQAGDLPGVKVSNQWRFVRGVIDAWLNTRMQAGRDTAAGHGVPAASQASMARLLSTEHIVMDIAPGAKRDVLARLVAPLQREGLLADVDLFLDELEAREAIVSTAIARGLACPHVRIPEQAQVHKTCLVAGVCREGTAFDALDGTLTRVFILPCSDSETAHLRLMARIALAFRDHDLVDKLCSTSTPVEFLRCLAAAEARARTHANTRGQDA